MSNPRLLAVVILVGLVAAVLVGLLFFTPVSCNTPLR